MIDLPSFYMDMEGARNNRPDYRSTTRDVAKLLDEFRSKQVDAVILDLSRNGGGSLTEAISLTGLFVDEGPIVQVKDKNGKKTVYNDPNDPFVGQKWDGPLVVLTSKFSASASEIFAGAIQDYHRGLIVGDKSDARQGNRAESARPGAGVLPVAAFAAAGGLEDYHATVLPARWRQHAESRRAGRYSAAGPDRRARRRRT